MCDLEKLNELVLLQQQIGEINDVLQKKLAEYKAKESLYLGVTSSGQLDVLKLIQSIRELSKA